MVQTTLEGWVEEGDGELELWLVYKCECSPNLLPQDFLITLDTWCFFPPAGCCQGEIGLCGLISITCLLSPSESLHGSLPRTKDGRVHSLNGISNLAISGCHCVGLASLLLSQTPVALEAEVAPITN